MGTINRKHAESVNNTSYLTSSNGDIKKARLILGECVSCLTDEELKDLITELRFLVETWLDEFEKKAFEGKTLKELIYERSRA